MVAYLRNQERKSTALDAAAMFKRKHLNEDTGKLFMDRQIDEEFAAVGRLALSHKVANRIEDHIFVWTGYEVITSSRYECWNY